MLVKKYQILPNIIRNIVVYKMFSIHFSGGASPTIWSSYANFKSFISLEIDCFKTQKYLHSMTKLSVWLCYRSMNLYYHLPCRLIVNKSIINL